METQSIGIIALPWNRMQTVEPNQLPVLVVSLRNNAWIQPLSSKKSVYQPQPQLSSPSLV